MTAQSALSIFCILFVRRISCISYYVDPFSSSCTTFGYLSFHSFVFYAALWIIFCAKKFMRIEWVSFFKYFNNDGIPEIFLFFLARNIFEYILIYRIQNETKWTQNAIHQPSYIWEHKQNSLYKCHKKQQTDHARHEMICNENEHLLYFYGGGKQVNEPWENCLDLMMPT